MKRGKEETREKAKEWEKISREGKGRIGEGMGRDG